MTRACAHALMNRSPDLSNLYAHHFQTLCQRAETALSRARCSALLIPSGAPHYHPFDDREYPFAVNPHFKTWVPLTEIYHSWLVFYPGKRPTLIYYQPKEIWNVTPPIPSAPWTSHFDIQIIRTPEQALTLLPPPGAQCAIIGEGHSALGPYQPNNPPAALNYLHYQRAFKTPYEIALIRFGQQRAVRGHRAIVPLFHAGASEFALYLAYCAAVGQEGHDQPYDAIVALNTHAAVLHYSGRLCQPPKQHDSLLLDAGASQQGYAADISRTHAGHGQDEFQALIDAVDTAQQDICQQVRAGTEFTQLHRAASLRLMKVLRDADIITVCAETAVETSLDRVFFPHGIGHLLGAQVHDVGGHMGDENGGLIRPPTEYSALRLTRCLAPAMVVTIEPGIYFIDQLLDQAQASTRSTSINWNRVALFKRYGGIRIEDNLVCTEAAPENMTRAAFASEEPTDTSSFQHNWPIDSPAQP